MKNELEKQIMDIAPYMFNYEGSDNIQQSLLPFGFECCDGWYGILKELVEKIAQIDKDKTVKVVQVKEKFGTLRFYIEGGSKEIYDLIDKAETKSETTCEYCGAEGRSRGYSWAITLCDNCYTRYQNGDRK